MDQLLEQIKPFDAGFHLDAQVTEVAAVDDRFRVVTSRGEEFDAGAVVIAGGVGSFQPMPLRVAGIEQFLDSQVFYRVRDPSAHRGKDLLVLGGGDSAFDWTVELAPHAKSMTLVHRSDRFRAAPATVARMRELEAAGQVRFMIGNCVDFEAANGSLERVCIRHTDESVTKVDIDHALVFFGLSPKLGPIAEWGLELSKSQIPTDTERFETNIPGIYAIGDIATYPGQEEAHPLGFPRSGARRVRHQGQAQPEREGAPAVHDDEPDHARAARGLKTRGRITMRGSIR